LIYGWISIYLEKIRPLNVVFFNVLALAAEFGDVHSDEVNAVERFLGIFVAGLDVIG
jgi:hypothetical protein